jgi:hypothetical protein
MGAVSFCTTTGVGIAAAETGATLEDGFTDEEEEEEDEEEEEVLTGIVKPNNRGKLR